MPELAAVYGIGFIFCLALTMVYVYLRSLRRTTDAAVTVQTNLRKVGLYWSDHQDAVVRYSAKANESETKKSQLAIGYTGMILSLLSWGGVVFLLIIMLSERFFARSRRERRLFGSVIAHDPNLPAVDVQRQLDELDVCNDSPAEAATTI